MALDIVHGIGYRVSCTDRVIGGPTGAPDGFVVCSLKSGKLFIADGGIWEDGGTFPTSDFTQDNLDTWILS